MALTPWHLTHTLEDYEAAALLAGYEKVDPFSDDWLLVDTRLIGRWVERMIEAAFRSEIALCNIYTTPISPVSPHKEFAALPPSTPVPLEDMIRDKLKQVTFNVERSELYRWLLAQGIPDERIPEAIRVFPQPNESKAPSPHQDIEDDIRTLEAMGLLVEAYINQRGPDYRHGDKPKVSRIVDDMLNAKPEDVTKMSKRKLQDIVGDALKAWEAKKLH